MLVGQDSGLVIGWQLYCSFQEMICGGTTLGQYNWISQQSSVQLNVVSFWTKKVACEKHCLAVFSSLRTGFSQWGIGQLYKNSKVESWGGLNHPIPPWCLRCTSGVPNPGPWQLPSHGLLGTGPAKQQASTWRFICTTTAGLWNQKVGDPWSTWSLGLLGGGITNIWMILSCIISISRKRWSFVIHLKCDCFSTSKQTNKFLFEKLLELLFKVSEKRTISCSIALSCIVPCFLQGGPFTE